MKKKHLCKLFFASSMFYLHFILFWIYVLRIIYVLLRNITHIFILDTAAFSLSSLFNNLLLGIQNYIPIYITLCIKVYNFIIYMILCVHFN